MTQTGTEENLEKTLAREELELQQNKEIQRVLGCFQLDAYTVLDLKPGVSPSDIKKVYRKKSLLIHPDKTSNKQAAEAFDVLKKAYNTLDDIKSRETLDDYFTDARRELIRERRWDLDDERLKSDAFLVDWRDKVKQLIIEEELVKKLEKKRENEEEVRKRKLEEEEIASRKKVHESNQKWEESRDKRVENWRSFSKVMENKKKKKKSKVLV